MDLIQKLGALALASRLKRISERLQRDVSRIYRSQNVDFESRWFPVLYLLKENKQVSIMEAARSLGLTHPAINQIAGEMADAGLVASARDKTDERRRLLSLTKKGETTLARLEPIWTDVEAATQRLIESAGTGVMRILASIESELDNESMYERIKKLIAKRQQS
jgi:DNA-binding MarR family transcriptional regulator